MPGYSDTDPLADLETPEERAERESLKEDKPRRGRPPGSVNGSGDAKKPKISEEALHNGCIALVHICYWISGLVARAFDGKLTRLDDGEIEQGAREAKPLIMRFGWLVVLLMILGFPLWIVRTAIAHFKSNVQEKDAKLLTIVPDAAQVAEDAAYRAHMQEPLPGKQ